MHSQCCNWILALLYLLVCCLPTCYEAFLDCYLLYQFTFHSIYGQNPYGIAISFCPYAHKYGFIGMKVVLHGYIDKEISSACNLFFLYFLLQDCFCRFFTLIDWMPLFIYFRKFYEIFHLLYWILEKSMFWFHFGFTILVFY